MLGIDITKISRFEGAKKTFIKKILHHEEIKDYEKTKEKAKFLAAHWAIKEAMFKTDNNNFNFHEINLTLKDRVYEYPGYTITTTSEEDYYVAFVMKEK